MMDSRFSLAIWDHAASSPADFEVHVHPTQWASALAVHAFHRSTPPIIRRRALPVFEIELDAPPVRWSKIHIGRFVHSVALLVEPEASQPRRGGFPGARPTWWPHYDSNQPEARFNYAGLLLPPPGG